MSAYTDKFDDHSVHTHLKTVQEELLSVEDMQDKPPAAIETLARVALVVKNFSLALETCNKNLVSMVWLDESGKALANIKSYLTNYKSNKDVNALNSNCSGQLDVLLQTSAKINCVKSAQSLRGIVAAENEYKRVMDLYNMQLHEKVSALMSVIEDLRKRIDDQNTISQKHLSDLQSAITSEKQRLDSFSTSYQSQMAEDQKRFSAMSDMLKDSFSKAQEDRKEAFSEEVEKIKKQSEAIDKNATLQSEEIKEESNKLIDEYKQQFEEYKQQVVNIVGIVNTNMFSHKYKEVADDARKRARLWHRIAVIFMIAVGIFAIYAFVITVNSDTSWVKLVAKIFATTTFVTGAAYAARQASKQEKVERYSRKIEMELVAIDPFIDSLDDEKKSLIKEEIARKIFGNADAMEISSKDEAYTAMDKLTSIEEVLKSLVTIFGKLPK